MSMMSFAVCFLAVVVVMVAGNPGYGYKPMAPAYMAPSYSAPAYKAPAYRAPAYSPPAYSPPAYSPPAYSPPAYRAPAYMAPAPSYFGSSKIQHRHQQASSFRQLHFPANLKSCFKKSFYNFDDQMSMMSFAVCFLAAVVVMVAGNPGYGYKPMAPAYMAPSYSAPAYKAPAYRAPAYSPPAYSPPAYRAPAYSPPAYRAPAYMAPAPLSLGNPQPGIHRYSKK